MQWQQDYNGVISMFTSFYHLKLGANFKAFNVQNILQRGWNVQGEKCINSSRFIVFQAPEIARVCRLFRLQFSPNNKFPRRILGRKKVFNIIAYFCSRLIVLFASVNTCSSYGANLKSHLSQAYYDLWKSTEWELFPSWQLENLLQKLFATLRRLRT